MELPFPFGWRSYLQVHSVNSKFVWRELKGKGRTTSWNWPYPSEISGALYSHCESSVSEYNSRRLNFHQSAQLQPICDKNSAMRIALNKRISTTNALHPHDSYHSRLPHTLSAMQDYSARKWRAVIWSRLSEKYRTLAGIERTAGLHLLLHAWRFCQMSPTIQRDGNYEVTNQKYEGGGHSARSRSSRTAVCKIHDCCSGCCGCGMGKCSKSASFGIIGNISALNRKFIRLYLKF